MALTCLLVACAGRSPDGRDAASPDDHAVVAPNPNLVTQGIPPVPAALADQVARYTDFRGHQFADWHPTRREMLVLHRPAGASTVQLFRVAAPLAEPEPLTDTPDPVHDASYEPRDGRYIVFSRASGGNEQYKLYRLDLPSRQVTVLTDTPARHSFEGWLHRSSQLLTLSSPLDRTAAGGTRATITQTLSLLDPLDPTTPRRLAELPGGGWGVGSVAWDDRRIALTRYLSATEAEIWTMDLQDGRLTQLLPSTAHPGKAAYAAGEFSRDGRRLFLTGNRSGEFTELQQYRFADRSLASLTRQVPWDIDAASLNAADTVIAAEANADGRRELLLYDTRQLKALPKPATPPGSLGALRFHPRLADLGFAVSSAQGPSAVWSLNPASGAFEPWTRAVAPPGIDTQAFAAAKIVRWPSFDRRLISGILTYPPARFTGKRPVLIDIHGGPEGQATAGFLGRASYWVEELGIAVIQPNVRGSSGYGKTFVALDDGMKREDSVKDIGALLDWIARQPELDASRVAVIGGSYGGYMSLAVAATYSDRIAGAVDIVGISNFLTFLQSTESYRRDLRRVEYGDERDPAMRAFLEKISPLTNAAAIRKPLFVVQGKNDPRVPYTEAEQIVARVRENGVPVWYLRAENEGHGFARKENADFQFYATTMFLQQVLRLP